MYPISSRRKFLKQSALVMAGAATGFSGWMARKSPKLAFSTLGCPDWNFDKIMDFAVLQGYSGLEIRGILREMDLPKAAPFATAEARQETLRKMRDHGLSFINLGSSSTLHFPEGAERQKQIEDGKRFIDLAHELNCPFIRVFPNNFIKGQEKSATLELIAKGLDTLGAHAKGSKVEVLMETHGDLVQVQDLLAVMQQVSDPRTGLIWDISNMWTVTKVAPAEVYPQLKKYIRHTHIKDARLVNGTPQYVFLGKGEVPILDAVDILIKDKYRGYYSFEWEKLWHPEIAEPDLAFPDFVSAMRPRFDKK